MPTYEYACKSCAQHLEVVQKFSDAALTDCPQCGGQLRKVFGSVGISFKGSGFYKNDSRPSSSKSTSSTDSTNSSASSGNESSSGSGSGSGSDGASKSDAASSDKSSSATSSDSSSKKAEKAS